MFFVNASDPVKPPSIFGHKLESLDEIIFSDSIHIMFPKFLMSCFCKIIKLEKMLRDKWQRWAWTRKKNPQK